MPPARPKQNTESDWSSTPAAMLCAVVLGIASITGLVWTITTPDLKTIQSSEQPSQADAPGRYLIDLNTADASQMSLLPGIGPRLAQRIAAHRDEHGAYKSIDDLDHVKGIGPKTIQRISDWVRISQP